MSQDQMRLMEHILHILKQLLQILKVLSLVFIHALSDFKHPLSDFKHHCSPPFICFPPKYTSLGLFFMQRFHPGCHRHSSLALDDTTKGAVTAVAALLGQLLCSNGTL